MMKESVTIQISCYKKVQKCEKKPSIFIYYLSDL